MDTAEHYTEAFARAACAMPTVAGRDGRKTRDPRSIRDALLDGPLDRIDQIIMHGRAPLAVGRVDERLAQAG